DRPHRVACRGPWPVRVVGHERCRRAADAVVYSGGRTVPAEPTATALDALFDPSSIALVGASDSSLIFRSIYRSLRAVGYPGQVFPVNPRRDTVFDLPCYPTVSAVPEPVGLAVIGIPAAAVPAVLAECGDRKSVV